LTVFGWRNYKGCDGFPAEYLGDLLRPMYRRIALFLYCIAQFLSTLGNGAGIRVLGEGNYLVAMKLTIKE